MSPEPQDQQNRQRLSVVAHLVLVALAVIGGVYLLSVGSPPSVYSYAGGLVLLAAGVLLKSLHTLSVGLKQRAEEKGRLTQELLAECRKNLELVVTDKIRWPQVHFNVASYRAAEENALFPRFPSKIRDQLMEAYELISHIEKRKFSAFDKETNAKLRSLTQILQRVIQELERTLSKPHN